MSTPQMPNIPGAAVMTDTLDFVKNLWGSMGVPGLASPTLSLDELDKKISDLKAVESWLNLNTAMLRSSIQALEVQRGTIATLKSMGQSLAESMQQKPGRPDKSFFEANPYAAAFFHQADAAKGAARPAQPPAAPAGAAAPKVEARPTGEPPQQKPDLAAAAAAQMANPAAWWNLLQEQFTHAVSTAMAPDAKAAAAPPADAGPDDDAKADSDAKAAAARKPAVKKAPPKKE